MKYQFASDNTSGICPEAWQALMEANQGFTAAYGDDSYTARAADMFREIFECDCDVYFVFNGTAANSLALASLCQSYHSVICHERGHIETDECGAPEFFSNGTKLLLAGGALGKISPSEAEQIITKRSDIHYPRPKVISLTQATELGTVYQPEEIRELSALARRYSMRLHMDGARFANAAASLNLPPRCITWEAGVDVLSFGGAKNGGLSEAVVFFDRELAQEFDYRCKQAGQLASKMRFLSAPWATMLANQTWLQHARHSNACARRLAEELTQTPGVKVLYPVEANSVFVQMPQELHQHLQSQGWKYYVFIGGGARFMCSWLTSEADLQALIEDIKTAPYCRKHYNQ